MEIKRKPDWLKVNFKTEENYTTVKKNIEKNGLHTICLSGKCPNMGHCWSKGTAAFMILGDICTRNCRFCATKKGVPLPPDPDEPQKIANNIKSLNIRNCVITSVDRDDIIDKGALHWANTIAAIRAVNPSVIIEILIPDYEEKLLDVVLRANPDIVAHNLETVERLTSKIRSRATYTNSMNVLKNIAQKNFVAKTGIMVGMGETENEVFELLKQCKNVGCDMITIGQYLQPDKNNIEVAEYVTPEQFEKYRIEGERLGFLNIESAPLVRSSYMAENSFDKILKKENKNEI